jgi:hypothetical protein
MHHPIDHALYGDAHEPRTHSASANVRKWLRAYEKRNSAQVPVQGKPDTRGTDESGDRAMSVRTLLAVLRRHVPFTASQREKKRLQRERKDWPRHLRKYLATQADLHLGDNACEPPVVRTAPVHSNNRISVPGNSRLHGPPALSESTRRKQGNGNGAAIEDKQPTHLRDLVA